MLRLCPYYGPIYKIFISYCDPSLLDNKTHLSNYLLDGQAIIPTWHIQDIEGTKRIIKEIAPAAEGDRSWLIQIGLDLNRIMRHAIQEVLT